MMMSLYSSPNSDLVEDDSEETKPKPKSNITKLIIGKVADRLAQLLKEDGYDE